MHIAKSGCGLKQHRTLLIMKDKRTRIPMLGGVLIWVKLHVRGCFQKNKKYNNGNSGENTKGTIDGENFSENKGGTMWY